MVVAALAPVFAGALAPPRRLRLLTFDLDDTFWPTGAVVARANEAMRAALAREGADGAGHQDAMKRLRRAAGPAMSYTEARTEACAALLAEAGADVALAPQLFDVWLDERHRAAEALLFDGSADALREVTRRHPDAVVAAVTNGRGDPARMPSLKPFFAFTVSGEAAGVHPNRKPSPVIYEAALERAGVSNADDAWIHVGDCLLNDCDAAKRVGARTVWLDASPPSHAQNAYSTLSADDRAARAAVMDAVDPAAAVDARILTIAELPDAVDAALA